MVEETKNTLVGDPKPATAYIYLVGGSCVEVHGETAKNLYSEFLKRLEEIDQEIIRAEAASRGITTARFSPEGVSGGGIRVR